MELELTGRRALVTGATDGIGKAYAFALAKRGFDLVLVSRSAFKLQNVAADIEQKFTVKTKIVQIDFTSSDKDYGPQLEKEIADLDIGILVNNVGMSYDYPEEFLAVENGAEKVRDLINVNVTSVNAITRIVLPAMADRGKGAVINISSMSCMTPTPLLAVYAASKAYVDCFSANLAMEYEKKGVTVQCVLPGYVVSNMSKLRRPSLIAPTPDTFVASALKRLGVVRRTTGYWSHDLMIGVTSMLPVWLAEWSSYSVLSGIRRKAIKNKEKKK